ncbi:hypothetical protein RJ639_009854 [Escallonia herrerae]|uniref:Uncharacterized protein n=1 Tax=Escallonia herrerae TaxID=1293975 RepID=A0AA88VRE6_9ASTE|nr:hypothetical protein RJ639_009854 [Escallonia herrerae]
MAIVAMRQTYPMEQVKYLREVKPEFRDEEAISNIVIQMQMSSRKGGSLSKGKGVSEVSRAGINQLTDGVADVSLDSAQDDGWEVYSRKPRGRAGGSSAKSWAPAPQNSNSKAWGHSDVLQKVGLRGNGESGTALGNAWQPPASDSRRPAWRENARQNIYSPTSAAIVPPPQQAWKLPLKSASSQSSQEDPMKIENISAQYADDVGEVEDGDDSDDASDGEFLSDDFDSDSSQKSYETRKKSMWFKAFFESLETLTVEQINDPARQWHCPACKNGPGAIDWYRGLQPLMTHAKTKGSKRVMLHRELAELLEEELRRRGTSVVPAGEAFGKWKGLDDFKDKDIVWPPMVVVMNTRLEKDENDKARHAYGPQGHRGSSLLIFEASAVGYLEAERLSKHFEDQGTDREAWDRRRVPFYPGGQRQLYGYMAEKGDLDYFNQHAQGKTKLKFEMRSYQEMVVSQMKQMSEDNQQLLWFKNRVVKEQKHSKALEESFGVVTEKLRQTLEESRIVRHRTKMHHEQNKEEMDSQEQFFKEQIQIIHSARDAKEDNFEKIQQEEREKVKVKQSSSTSIEDRRHRLEELAKFIKIQDKEMEDFVEEREKLIKVHEEKKVVMKRRHWEEEVALEKELDAEFSRLMEKYTPPANRFEERSKGGH